MNILLVYYHPICFDFATTLLKLGHKVTISVNQNIKDNYGTGTDIIKKNSKQYVVIPNNLALAQIAIGKYDLVGCDGVFDGDKLIMDVCKSKNVPYFCIDGYPNTFDEPSDNILTFGWSLPILQYNNKFPFEGHKKQIDWKDIAEKGRSQIKNFCVFYPNMWYMHSIESIKNFNKKKLISGIQRFKECNEWNYKVFNQIKEKLLDWEILNLEKIEHEEFLNKLNSSCGLLHLKWADKPGISVLEAMWLGRPIITLNSFILSSFNQELLIDNYTAIVADSIDELIKRINVQLLIDLGKNAKNHIKMLCDFHRQIPKLNNFLERCIK